MKFLFSSILSAASRSLLLSTRLLGLRIDAVAVNCDVTDAREVALLATHPWVIEGIDVLVLNHGRYDRIDAKDLDLTHLRRTMSTNFEGAFLVWTPRPSVVNGEKYALSVVYKGTPTHVLIERNVKKGYLLINKNNYIKYLVLLFDEFNRAGVTVVVVSHNLSLISQLGHRIIFLKEGSLI